MKSKVINIISYIIAGIVAITFILVLFSFLIIVGAWSIS